MFSFIMRVYIFLCFNHLNLLKYRIEFNTQNFIMFTEIEILHRGLTRKISRTRYSKLRTYNKIPKQQLQQYSSRVEDSLDNLHCSSYPQTYAEELYEQNQTLKEKIGKIQETNSNMQKQLRREKRLIKLINPKILKIKEQKNNGESSSRVREYTDKDIQQIWEIKLELEVAELQWSLEKKNQELQELSQKKKNNRMNSFINKLQTMKQETVGLFISNNNEMEQFINNLEEDIKKCSEENKSLESKFIQLQKSARHKKVELEEAAIELKEAIRALEQRKQMMKTSKAEEYLEGKGGQIKNSFCLEQEINQAQGVYEEMEKQLADFMQQKIRIKIEKIREIEVYDNLLKRHQTRK